MSFYRSISEFPSLPRDNSIINDICFYSICTLPNFQSACGNPHEHLMPWEIERQWGKEGFSFWQKRDFFKKLKSLSLEVHHYRSGQHNILYETFHTSLRNIFSWWMVNRNFCEQGRLVSLLRLNSVLCSPTQFHFRDPEFNSTALCLYQAVCTVEFR